VLRAWRQRLGEGRIGRIESAGAVGVAVSRLPYDVRVPESRSAGATRSGRAAAEVDQRSHSMSVTICHFHIGEPSESALIIAAWVVPSLQ
jgi:hypothetical protein